IAMPTIPDRLWVGCPRCANRSATAPRATATDEISAPASELDARKTITKTRPGTTDSASPRTPPTASWSENSSPSTAPIPRPVVGADRSLTGTRLQLVARVEHRGPAVEDADQPADPHPSARLDPGDLAPTEPDQVECSRAVVQSRLQGEQAIARTKGHA